MLLNSVVLVLQETLEAALLVSVLLTISYQQWHRMGWVLIGIASGLLTATIYAANMTEISAWFDYVGQEIVNAFLQVTTTILIIGCSWSLARDRQPDPGRQAVMTRRLSNIFLACAVGIVALAITQEGSEILLYLGGFWRQEDYVFTVMTGSFIGFGIGLSTGILLFYVLSSLPVSYRLIAPVLLLALFAGNMLSQATLQLAQADWVSSEGIVWDSSDWLPENSIFGQLLYAFIGYEATPSLVQILAYGAGVILVLVARSVGNYSKVNTRTVPGTG